MSIPLHPSPTHPPAHPAKCSQLGDLEIALGDAVLLAADEDDESAPLALVQAMWQTSDGAHTQGMVDRLCWELHNISLGCLPA